MKDAARSKSSSLIDRCLREARQLLGVELDRTDRRKNLEASRSAIKRYSYGIGDDNPLWCNEVYARQTRYGGLIAPPSFLFSVDDTAFNQPRIPGLSLLHAEDEMEFLRPIFRDDQITSSCKIIDVEEKRGRRVPRMVKIVGELKYFDPNDSDRVFATILATKLRVPHAGEEGGLNYEKRQPHQYSQTEFEAIRRDVFEEERRGATPRYWEDVRPGDEMKPVVKGPLSLRDMICYYAGNGVPHEVYKAHELAFRGASYLDDPKHVEASLAHEVGMPGAYDIGHQRVAWVSHLLTNWMGDDGNLKKLVLRITSPNIFGDTTWCRGRIYEKKVVDGEHLVRCEVWTENQLGDITATGRAVVNLPSSSEQGRRKG